jgi:hypothetical protein
VRELSNHEGERTNFEGVRLLPHAQMRVRRHWRSVILFFVVWTAFAGMQVAKDWYALNAVGRAFFPANHVAQAAFIFYPWFVMSLAIGGVLRNFPKSMAHAKGYASHALFAAFVGLVHLLLITASIWIFFPDNVVNARFWPVFTEQFLAWFHFEILVYFAVLLVWRTLLSRRSPPDAGARKHRERITGKIDGETHIVAVDLIDWFESQNNYVIAHNGARSIKLRQTMKSLDFQLDKKRFVRVHRRALVNVDRLRCLEGAHLVMTNGDRVACSRSGKQALKRLLFDCMPTQDFPGQE